MVGCHQDCSVFFWSHKTPACRLHVTLSLGRHCRFLQEEFDNDVDALLEEGMPVPKKMRPSEDKYGGDSDHPSDAEEGVQPMMTKIKTVLKSEWHMSLLS